MNVNTGVGKKWKVARLSIRRWRTEATEMGSGRGCPLLTGR